MFSNLSAEEQDSISHYPITDSSMPFADYIEQCQTTIASRREDLDKSPDDAQKILHANTPFEFYPPHMPPKAGVLLIHGLLDCPFTYREIGSRLQQQGLLTRSILLPGHGTRPSDLLHITYHDWLQAARYGIETLKKEVDSIFLVGYSTGAALSIYQALQDDRIAGIILVSPCLKIRLSVDMVANWLHFTNYLVKVRPWIVQCEENDYAKYRSVTVNAVRQVIKLTDTIRELCREHTVKQPIHMILSREDETISSHEAIEFFTSMQQPASKLLLYTASDNTYADTRIETRKAIYPELHIKHLSHTSLLFSADNVHYGQNGDFIETSEQQDDKYIYGAYNPIEVNAFDIMAKYHLVNHPRRALTYNPDFSNMVDSISKFIADVL